MSVTVRARPIGTSKTASMMQHRAGTSLRPLVGVAAAISLSALGLVTAPRAYAVSYPECAVATFTAPQSVNYCVLPAGASITVTVKSGNGGAGGNGGRGGNSRAAGPMIGPGAIRSGGSGGTGGAGGAGAKSSTTWTNQSGSAITLKFTVAAIAVSSPSSTAGSNGKDGGVLSDGERGGDGATGTLSAPVGGIGGSGGAGGVALPFSYAGGAGGAGGHGYQTDPLGGNGGAGGSGGTGGAAFYMSGSSGGSGGDGGAGGAGGAGGGAGGNGGTGGNGGAGDNVGGVYKADGPGGDGGDGGAGGTGGRSLAEVVETSVTVLAPNPGLGGTGGSGGTKATPSGDGTAGTPGTAGSNGSGGTLATSASELPSISIDAIILAPPAPQGSSAAPASTVTLDLEPNGGTCSVGALTGVAASWVALPEASACSAAGMTLVGWQAPNSSRIYPPGSSVQLTGDNALRAIWAARTGGAGQPNAAPQSQRATSIRWVFWNNAGTDVRFGDPADLVGRRPVFTLVSTSAKPVTAAMVATAKALAAKRGGVYGGVIIGDWWRSPRIVAAYFV